MPIKCRWPSLHQRADSLTRLSADRPQRPSAEEKPSHCPIKCFRSVPTRSSLRVDIALHHQARSKCIQECSNAFIASRRHRSAPRPLFEVRRCNLHANLGEPRSLTEQQLSCSPESRSIIHRQMAKKRPNEIDRLVRHSALQEPLITNPTWIALHLHTRFAYNAAEYLGTSMFSVV